MASVFFSYSHADKSYRDELEKHLAVLRNQGVINMWSDRCIVAGDVIDQEIDANLDAADIILLLVSADFLNSEYCYKREMARALERNESGEARVIPVIIHPCDWQNSPFGKLRATPPDGQAISKFPNHHDAYLAIVTDIRQALEKVSGVNEPTPSLPISRREDDRLVTHVQRSSNRIWLAGMSTERGREARAAQWGPVLAGELPPVL